MAKKQKIVTIGGGSGQYTLLSALRDLFNINITAIVSMVDSGGSTGRLRDEFGVLPPGDILKCVLALSPERDTARKILQTRFKSHNRLCGHNAGNLLLTILSQHAGSFASGVEALAEVLNCQGKVLPVTIDKATLVAELTDGSQLYGEAAIDVPRGNQRQKIKNAFLVPHHSDAIKVYSPVIYAIQQADYIIIGPGDLYTSIVPNFLVPGVREAINKAKAKLIYIVNIMTKFGETDNYKASNFVKIIEKNIGKPVDFVIVNNKQPSLSIINKYKKEKASLVKCDLSGKRIIKADLLEMESGIIRHNIKNLSEVIIKIINK
ncbi:MAG: gluconeogenesis factor YvcK family protein [Candidatus Falkowbacteria bacterium]